jgi:hypothetical protein
MLHSMLIGSSGSWGGALGFTTAGGQWLAEMAGHFGDPAHFQDGRASGKALGAYRGSSQGDGWG